MRGGIPGKPCQSFLRAREGNPACEIPRVSSVETFESHSGDRHFIELNPPSTNDRNIIHFTAMDKNQSFEKRPSNFALAFKYVAFFLHIPIAPAYA